MDGIEKVYLIMDTAKNKVNPHVSLLIGEIICDKPEGIDVEEVYVWKRIPRRDGSYTLLHATNKEVIK